MSRWRSNRHRPGPLLVLLAVLLTACPDGTGSPPRGREPETTTSPAVDAPSPGDPIRFGFLGEPATLDPYDETASDLTRYIARAIYPSLFTLVPDGTPEPLLAADMEVDGSRATVQLLRSASWSDGSPLTARDVVASWRRARGTVTPSGFRDISSARAVDPATVAFRGEVNDWEATLARAAYILPSERDARTTAGPFRIARRTPGLEVVLEPDPLWFGRPKAKETIRVRFIRTTGTMLALLERGELDAAAFPSMVNAAERVQAAGLQADSALGWETIRLSFGTGLSRLQRAGVAEALDLGVMKETLIRSDGRRATTLHPAPDRASGPYRSVSGGTPPEVEISVTAPAGDELLTQLLRAVYAQLDATDVAVEAAPIDPFIFYGEWLRADPSDVSIRRASGAPGLGIPPDDPAGLDHFPLFQVRTYVVWRPEVEGPRSNPTLDGPLWNARDWTSTGGS
ncbi:MAG: hypothetical protein GEU78_01055 [Actinobacteria bacterium]|nr:hypothetical protein [Actinomycetota bacterium]